MSGSVDSLTLPLEFTSNPGQEYSRRSQREFHTVTLSKKWWNALFP